MNDYAELLLSNSAALARIETKLEAILIEEAKRTDRRTVVRNLGWSFFTASCIVAVVTVAARAYVGV